MASLAEIPVEVLLDNLLPSIPVSDILRLGSTNKFFASICDDDTFWKRKLQSDFNFSGAGTARTSGWKFIYKGLSRPQVFVWGEKTHGRLGLTRFPKSSIPGVPFPTRVRIPGVRIVSLIAGGMSFHALDSVGNIYVWGTLDGTSSTLNSDGYSEAGKKSDTPLRLEMSAATRSISCGRLHFSTLDSDRRIWTFLSWGRPFRLSSLMLDDSDFMPIQVECGWAFSSVLTKSGDVLVWWPFSGQMNERIISKNNEMDEEGDKKAQASPDGVIHCVTWALEAEPVKLRSLPPLPDLNNAGDEAQKPTRLIQIAALDGHLVGLTNKGHVLKYGFLDNETTAPRGSWEYLPKFSEVEKVKEHPTFDPSSGIDPPQSMQITHISAHFLHFIAYSTGSSSIVLKGDTGTTPESDPDIIPALQNKSVISVILGDYHNGALTSTGKLLTWGAYSKGALGLGDPSTLKPGTPGAFATEARRAEVQRRGRGEPPAVDVPTEVKFDHGRKAPKKTFCFSASASGWHTGALVIDLEPSGDDTDDEVEFESLDHNFPAPDTLPAHGPGETPPFVPMGRIGHAGRGLNTGWLQGGLGPFRLGFAGRGRHQGGSDGDGPSGSSS